MNLIPLENRRLGSRGSVQKPGQADSEYTKIPNRRSACRWPQGLLGCDSCFVGNSIWACAGPIFGYSDTWQLVINTGTTIVTFYHGVYYPKLPEPGYAGVAIEIDELSGGKGSTK
jgi:hypothetical protein